MFDKRFEAYFAQQFMNNLVEEQQHKLENITRLNLDFNSLPSSNSNSIPQSSKLKNGSSSSGCQKKQNDSI